MHRKLASYQARDVTVASRHIDFRPLLNYGAMEIFMLDLILCWIDTKYDCTVQRM